MSKRALSSVFVAVFALIATACAPTLLVKDIIGQRNTDTPQYETWYISEAQPDLGGATTRLCINRGQREVCGQVEMDNAILLARFHDLEQLEQLPGTRVELPRGAVNQNTYWSGTVNRQHIIDHIAWTARDAVVCDADAHEGLDTTWIVSCVQHDDQGNVVAFSMAPTLWRIWCEDWWKEHSCEQENMVPVNVDDRALLTQWCNVPSQACLPECALAMTFNTMDSRQTREVAQATLKHIRENESKYRRPVTQPHLHAVVAGEDDAAQHPWVVDKVVHDMLHRGNDEYTIYMISEGRCSVDYRGTGRTMTMSGMRMLLVAYDLAKPEDLVGVRFTANNNRPYDDGQAVLDAWVVAAKNWLQDTKPFAPIPQGP